MMFKEFFMLLVFAHVIGDFYVQTNTIAEKKKQQFLLVLLHGLFYWIVTLAVIIPVMSKELVMFGSLSAVVHIVIDIIKYFYISKRAKKRFQIPGIERNIFFFDQALHLLGIALIAYFYVIQGNTISVHNIFEQFLQTMGMSPKSLLTWAVVLSVIHKPANIAISLLLTPYKPKEKDDVSNLMDKKAGRFIGTLERVIIIFLIFLKQYSAIGLVLTAKSIARYDKITKDPAFSEYYLLGTLLSTLFVIFISFIL
jgi:hypothetical protein